MTPISVVPPEEPAPQTGLPQPEPFSGNDCPSLPTLMGHLKPSFLSVWKGKGSQALGVVRVRPPPGPATRFSISGVGKALEIEGSQHTTPRLTLTAAPSLHRGKAGSL